MISNLGAAGFVFVMASVFASIGWRAAIARRDRFALWNSAKSWSTAAGNILDIGVDVVTKSANVADRLICETSYKPRIAYAYSVCGRTYNGTKFDCADEGDTKSRAQAQISEYRPGDMVTIAYDPEDPLNSVLDRTIKPSEIADRTLSIYVGFSAAIFLMIMGFRVLT
jgi:hypothetical protein